MWRNDLILLFCCFFCCCFFQGDHKTVWGAAWNPWALHISVSESLWLAVEWVRGYLIIMTNMHGRGFRQQHLARWGAHGWQWNFYLSPEHHNYQYCLFTEWIFMPALLWGWCTAASLTVEYPSVWLTGRSHTALIRFHFEIFGSDGPVRDRGGPPSKSLLVFNCFFFSAHYSIPDDWLLICLSDGNRKKLILRLRSLFNVFGAKLSACRLTGTFCRPSADWSVCLGLYTCVKSHSEGGVYVKRNTQHQEAPWVTNSFGFFFSP